MRPRQWYKNAIIFVPLVFAGQTFEWTLWPPVLVTFLAFCLLSGGAYAVNDTLDAPRDRLHATKRHRPVASGALPAWAAWVLAAIYIGAGLTLLAAVNYLTLLMGVLYLILQAAYNLYLKAVVLWDALAVAGGFVLRAIAGTTATLLGDPTEWLIVCTFLFAFYLALAKRRHELLLGAQDPSRQDIRVTLRGYSVDFLEQTMQVSTALLLAAYSLYTFFGNTAWMMTTLPFAYYGIFRYSYLVHRRDIGDEAEMIFRDRATLLNAAAWLATVLAVQSGAPQALFSWLEGLA